MKSIIPLTTNSLKNLRSYLKSVPNKIYSIEIKINTENVTKLPILSEGVKPITANTDKPAKDTVKESLSSVTQNKALDKKSKQKSNDVSSVKKLSHNERIDRTERLVLSLKHSWSIATLPN
ncbi:hypothetical protein BLA29_013639, partial [Euroglyphus maynei]